LLARQANVGPARDATEEQGQRIHALIHLQDNRAGRARRNTPTAPFAALCVDGNSTIGGRECLDVADLDASSATDALGADLDHKPWQTLHHIPERRRPYPQTLLDSAATVAAEADAQHSAVRNPQHPGIERGVDNERHKSHLHCPLHVGHRNARVDAPPHRWLDLGRSVAKEQTAKSLREGLAILPSATDALIHQDTRTGSLNEGSEQWIRKHHALWIGYRLVHRHDDHLAVQSSEE
jgi:hypothetical protein